MIINCSVYVLRIESALQWIESIQFSGYSILHYYSIKFHDGLKKN